MADKIPVRRAARAVRSAKSSVAWPLGLCATREGDWKAYGVMTPQSVKQFLVDTLNEKTTWNAYPTVLAAGILGEGEGALRALDVRVLIGALKRVSGGGSVTEQGEESRFVFVVAGCLRRNDDGGSMTEPQPPTLAHAEVLAELARLDACRTRVEVVARLTRILKESGSDERSLQSWYEWWMKQKIDIKNLDRSTLPPRPAELLASSLSDVVFTFERFARAHPEQAEEAAKRCVEIAGRYRPLNTERVLGMADAVRITGLSEARIKQLASDENRKFGEKKGSRWVFSEAELVRLARTPRPAGRPKAD